MESPTRSSRPLSRTRNSRVHRPAKSPILSAMIRKAARCLEILVAVLAVAAPAFVLADDGAASIAAGGLVPRRETRIVMAKEVLKISTKKVEVDYDFRNDSDQDVSTEVAFPVPPYSTGFPQRDPSDESFADFRLWVDGKPVRYEMEAKAFLKGKDVTERLRSLQIDIPTLGHFVDNDQLQAVTQDFVKLPKAAQKQLIHDGLFEDQGDGSGTMTFAFWKAVVQFHWTQTFPAHSTVHIRHEYAPVVGDDPLSLLLVASTLDPAKVQKQGMLNDNIKHQLKEGLLTNFCTEPTFLRTIQRDLLAAYPPTRPDDLAETGGIEFRYEWVDFILTTANTWQQPIEDFTLIVERPQPDSSWRNLVSFCSPKNGKVEKLDADHFQVHLTNFIPTAELHIGFFEVPTARRAQPAARK